MPIDIMPIDIMPMDVMMRDDMAEAPPKLRVLQVHNHYAPGWGGEDTVVELEAQLLRDHGHEVDEFTDSTAGLKTDPLLRQLLAAPSFLWSRHAYQDLAQKIAKFQPDVLHVHNTFPKLSPAVFWAGHRAGLPVVQTLHNFRLVCSNTHLFRDHRPCEKCIGEVPWPALRHRCYQNSFARTAVVGAIGALHTTLGTYHRAVDAHIALNDFSRQIFVRGGLPADKLFVKPNFVPHSDLGSRHREMKLVFAGVISRSKGVELLLEAWRMAAIERFDLVLIGDGPDRERLQHQYAEEPRVTWLGRRRRSEVLEHIAASRALVFPSLAAEHCPMVVLEAFSVATPVITANHPSLQAMVWPGREGLMFEAGNVKALAAVLREAAFADTDIWSGWSSAARRTQRERFSEDVNYGQLMSIYQGVTQKKFAPADDLSLVSMSSSSFLP
jgi:glycosyltransferase involved in cell wall biosynthesis